MKKIIVLVLTLALCMTALTSCFLKNRKTLKEITEMYSNSAPTMVVATTKQTFKSYELNAKYEVKNGLVLWPLRTALSGKQTTPGGGVELLHILGKEESLRRMKIGIEKLS